MGGLAVTPSAARTGTVVAALFPGQGSQGPGMGLPWSGHPAWAVVEEAEQVLKRDITTFLTDPDRPPSGTVDTHLAVVVTSLVSWVAFGPQLRSALLAGHSLGLLSALCAAGVLSTADTIQAVGIRAEVTERACRDYPGGMAAVLAPVDVAEAACAGRRCWVANDNSPGQGVLSGERDALEEAMAEALRLGAQDVIQLDIAGAFHSPLMSVARREFAERLTDIEFRPSLVDLAYNGQIHPAGSSTAWQENVADDLVRPVRWRENQLALTAYGVDHVVEVGFGRTLTGLAKRTLPGVELHNSGSPAVVARTLAALGRADSPVGVETSSCETR